MTRTITDHEDALIADLERAEVDLKRAEATIEDIRRICRNHDTYTAKTRSIMIEQRINGKDTK
jgi:hypothetical protein